MWWRTTLLDTSSSTHLEALHHVAGNMASATAATSDFATDPSSDGIRDRRDFSAHRIPCKRRDGRDHVQFRLSHMPVLQIFVYHHASAPTSAESGRLNWKVEFGFCEGKNMLASSGGKNSESDPSTGRPRSVKFFTLS